MSKLIDSCAKALFGCPLPTVQVAQRGCSAVGWVSFGMLVLSDNPPPRKSATNTLKIELSGRGSLGASGCCVVGARSEQSDCSGIQYPTSDADIRCCFLHLTGFWGRKLHRPHKQRFCGIPLLAKGSKRRNRISWPSYPELNNGKPHVFHTFMTGAASCTKHKRRYGQPVLTKAPMWCMCANGT